MLKYTSGTLPRDLDVIGPISAELYVSSDRATCDFFVRLCDVDLEGCSTNICDGLARVRFPSLEAPVEGAHRVQVTLWPTAHGFQKGHRLN